MVQELISQIVEKTGIPADKAQQVLGVVANFVKQKYPMVGSQIDNVLGAGGNQGSNDAGTGGASNFMGDIGGKLGL